SPSRVDMNAMWRPSGAQRGVSSLLPPAMSCRGGPEPSAGTTQMSALRVPLVRSVVVRTNATSLPSGDSCGSETRIAPIRSVIAIGRAAAHGDAIARNAAVDAPTRDRLFAEPAWRVGDM